MPKRLTQSQFISALCEMGKGYASLLLGAGASRSSGVLLAREIVHDIVATEYCHHSRIPVEVKKRIPASEVRAWLELQDWFRDARARSESEYSAIFRQFKPTHDHQIRYVSSLLDGATPSPAYQALAHLMHDGVFPVVLTTNFDPLLENCYRGTFQSEASLRVIESPDEFRMVTVEPGRVILGHLHGNLNGYDIANLDESTALLKPDVAHAVTRLLSQFVLVVIGYSGHDASVMGLLESLARDSSAFGRGVVYWCHPQGSEVSQRVIAFLDSVQSGFTVEIPGFDQLVKALTERLNIGREAFRTEPRVELDEHGGVVATAAAINVALVRSLPSKLLRFRTGLKEPSEIADLRSKHDWWQATLYDGDLWLVGNPEELPSKMSEAISARPIEVVLDENTLCDPVVWRVFVELANKGLANTFANDLSLRQFRGRRFFFPKLRGRDDRKVKYKSRKVRANRRVVWKAFTRGEKDAETTYYLHEAVRADVTRFAGRVCLAIRPTRLFTISGEDIWDSEAARTSIGRSTGKVWNEPYDALVRLWLDVLSRDTERVTVRFSADGRKPEYRLEFGKRPLEAQQIEKS